MPGSLVDDLGHKLRHIQFLQYFSNNFYLLFHTREQLEITSQLLGWSIIEVPFSKNTHGLLVPLNIGTDLVTCLNPLTQKIFWYSDFYIRNEHSGSTMQMLLMVKKSFGESQLILDQVTDLTFVNGDYTVWFENEPAYQSAKEETGWEDGSDEFGLAFSLDTISTLLLY